MDHFAIFCSLPLAESAIDFVAVELSSQRRDFLARAADGSPVFLLQDASAPTYTPAIELKNISVRFHSTCRVTTTSGDVEDQFAVVACGAAVPELYEVFVRCFAAAVEQLPVTATTSDLQRCVQALLDLFLALARPSSKEINGLWAELFVIFSMKDVAQALSAWHDDPFELYDFSWPDGCLEVKATVKDTRQHEFSLAQLQPPVGGRGFVASVLLQPLNGGVGVTELASHIERSVASLPQLRQKLWENVAAALGSDFSARLDRRFDLSFAEHNLVIYLMGDIPTPERPSDPRISGVRFKVDLSDVVSSLPGGPRQGLQSLFG